MSRKHGTEKAYRDGCHCDECRGAWNVYRGRRTDWTSPTPELSCSDRVAEIYAPQDAERMARLDYIVKTLGRCKVCGSTLTDESLSRHPGLCSYHAKKGAHRVA